MTMPSNPAGQTACPECSGSGKQYIRGNMDEDWREIECKHCRGTGTNPSEPGKSCKCGCHVDSGSSGWHCDHCNPSEPGLGSLPGSPETDAVTEESCPGTGESRPDTIAADSLGQELLRALVESNHGTYHDLGPFEALIRRRESEAVEAFTEQVKALFELPPPPTSSSQFTPINELIDAELAKWKEGE